MSRRRKLTPAQVGRKYGFRSGLEKQVGVQLTKEGIDFEYEAKKVPFIQPAKKRTYTPDFFLPNGIVIESKGRFLTADRQKHKWLKDQYPALDLRFLFSNSRSRISKRSKTTYGLWCESHGFKYADRTIPTRWLEEPPNEASLAVIEEITSGRAAERITETIERLKHLYTQLS